MSTIAFMMLGFSLAQPPGAPFTNLRSRIEGLASRSGGRLGVGIELLETRESLQVGGDQRLPMHSVYKLPIAMAVLNQVDRGLLRLDQSIRVEPAAYLPAGWLSPIRERFPQGTDLSVRELVRFMVAESDGSACDVLLGVLGGPETVMEYLGRIGVDGVQVVSTERAMSTDDQMQYRNWASPRGMLSLLRALHESRGLSPSSRTLLLKDLTESIPGAHRLKALLPGSAAVAHKTGTGKRGAVWSATNDVGIVTLPNGQHLAIAVLLMDSTGDEATREGTIAAVAKAAWETFANR